jgi:hypothetical protein
VSAQTLTFTALVGFPLMTGRNSAVRDGGVGEGDTYWPKVRFALSRLSRCWGTLRTSLGRAASSGAVG